MATEKINARQFWTLLFITSALLAAYGLFEGRTFIFGPAVLEAGDFAANGMRIFDAGHFNDLVGNYSRWGFSHPGPFFFYLYSFGEKIFFDLLKIVNSPHQAHVIAGTVFQSMCVALAMCMFAKLTDRRLTLYICLGCAALIIPHAQYTITSIWPPHVLFGPYILLIVSCAAVSLGWRQALPFAVFTTCVLCHGHVAQPLMTLPLLFLAAALYFRAARVRGESVFEVIRANRVQIWVSLAIVAIFLTPLLIDLSHCPDCNAYRIADYMHNNHDKRPRLRQAFNYLFSFFVFDHNPQWINDQRHIAFLTWRVVMGLISIGVLWALPKMLEKHTGKAEFRVVRAVALFTVVALVLSLVWAARITGPLYEFNAFFVYGIMFVGASAIATALSLVLRDGMQTGMASAFVLIAATVILVKAPALPVFSATNVLAVPNEAINDRATPPVTVLINQNANEDWPATTALALWLTRRDVDFMVPPNWAYVFGWEHSLDASRALQLDNHRFQIWEPGNDIAMLKKHIFELSAFCRISDASPLPTVTAEPMTLDDARRKCEVTAIGFGMISKDAWTWTVGHFVAMQFVGRRVDHPVQLNFDVFPYLGGKKLHEQIIHAYVNGSPIGDAELSSERVVSFSVPPATWNASKVVTLALMLPNAASPASLGNSRDMRIIGLGFKGMGIQYDHADMQTDQSLPAGK